MNTGHPLTATLEVSDLGVELAGTPVLSEVDLAVPAGTTTALLGPSGSGKTTLLRAVAGLEHPSSGRIAVGDELLSSVDRVVAPERRRIGMVFQDYALFPHLSVGANVGFGCPTRRGALRTGRTPVSDRVTAMIDLVGLTGLEDRFPDELSGGQQQRVALARALAPEPRVLLLDEPFSNLDLTLRRRIRTEVHRLLVDLGVTTLFVTHDTEEAFVLGDRIALLCDGRLVQHDTPERLYDRPVDPWVAGFVGTANLLPGRWHLPVAHTALGPISLEPHPAVPPGGEVDVLLRPEHLEVSPAGADPTAPGSGTVDLVEFGGRDLTVFVRLDGGTTVQICTPRQSLRRGDRVTVAARPGARVGFLRCPTPPGR